MNIDLNKLKISSSKKAIIDVIDSIAKNLNNFTINDVKYQIDRSIGLNTDDLNYILIFLENIRYIKIEDGKLIKIKEFDGEEAFDKLRNYYLNNILLDKNLRKNVFSFKDFQILDNDIYLDINLIDLEYRPIYIFLERLGIVESSKKDPKLKIVKSTVVAKSIYEKSLKKISKKDFDKIQKRKIEKGNLAEEFILNNEIEKLKGTSYIPERISEDYVNLGYDIISYDMDGNKFFIEVKSITNENQIFWTKNEIKCSKIYNELYKIYCVEFDNSGYPSSIKDIIINPYDEILNQKNYKSKNTGDLIVDLK